MRAVHTIPAAPVVRYNLLIFTKGDRPERHHRFAKLSLVDELGNPAEE
jgi:hypothetical protein